MQLNREKVNFSNLIMPLVKQFLVLADKKNITFTYSLPLEPIEAWCDKEKISQVITNFLSNAFKFTPSGGRTHLECSGYGKFIKLSSPILTNKQLEKLRGVSELNFKAKTINILFDATKKGAMQSALDKIVEEAEQAVSDEYQVIILSTRGISKTKASIPTLLALSAVHQHLVKKGVRTNCGLVVESGEAREIHHFATLIGYGANAINPYLAFETIEDMRKRKMIDPEITQDQAVQNYIKAIGKGIFKIMSKMGISTIRSYTGAQIFEAVGLSEEFVEKYFTKTRGRRC
jgi:hypothetical protein